MPGRRTILGVYLGSAVVVAGWVFSVSNPSWVHSPSPREVAALRALLLLMPVSLASALVTLLVLLRPEPIWRLLRHLTLLAIMSLFLVVALSDTRAYLVLAWQHLDTFFVAIPIVELLSLFAVCAPLVKQARRRPEAVSDSPAE